MAKPPVNFKILLDQANNIRLALAIGEGKLPELPKGIIGNVGQCVLAKALSNGWRAEVNFDEILLLNNDPEIDWKKIRNSLVKLGFKKVVIESEGRVSFMPTNTMSNFIRRFDDGDFPFLVLEKK